MGINYCVLNPSMPYLQPRFALFYHDGVACLVDEAGFEPATSTMPTWRSYQADLLAQFFAWLLKTTPPHLISISYSMHTK